jgi:hypothetical protein
MGGVQQYFIPLSWGLIPFITLDISGSSRNSMDFVSPVSDKDLKPENAPCA